MILLLIGSLAACGTNKNNVTKNETETTTTTEKNGTTDTVTDQTTETETETGTGTNVNGNEGHKVELADDVADKIAKMDEVESANVFVTDKNAYVAVVLKNGTNASEALETKIADEARSTNGNFNNVYVTTNPDFSKEFTDYGEKLRAGEPVSGFFEEFSDTIKRVFPDAH